MSSSSNNPFSVYGTPGNTGSPLGKYKSEVIKIDRSLYLLTCLYFRTFFANHFIINKHTYWKVMKILTLNADREIISARNSLNLRSIFSPLKWELLGLRNTVFVFKVSWRLKLLKVGKLWLWFFEINIIRKKSLAWIMFVSNVLRNLLPLSKRRAKIRIYDKKYCKQKFAWI